MSEIIYGVDMNTSTTNYTPTKRYCRQHGDMCELATDFGYCKLTSCFKRTYSLQTTWCNKPHKMDEVSDPPHFI